MIKARRSAVKKTAARKSASSSPRRVSSAKAAPALTPDEVSHLEGLVQRFEASEKAWQKMTAPLDDADPWTTVEDHLLERAARDSDRRWKFFSK